MKSPKAILNLAAPGLAACMLLLPWAAAVEAGEQASSYTETKLLAADGAEGDEFGHDVAISGDTVLIGAYQGSVVGSAYVFERDPLDPTDWNQTAKLTAADGAEGDHFGISVAIFGETAVIGAPHDALGSAYVFERDPSDPAEWIQIDKLLAPDGAKSEFGHSVAVSGNTAVIGVQFGGAAYAFERDPLDRMDWTQTAKLTAADGDSDFGNAVAIHGDTALIGASHFGFPSRSAYVFERDPLDPANWIQTAVLTAADGFDLDLFGVSVAISGDTAVIGAMLDDDLGFSSGSAYVFERNPLDHTDWIQTAKLTAADGASGDEFGISVAISGHRAVIGARFNGSGSAYVFERDPLDPTDWSQTAKLTAADGAPFDRFGQSVAILGHTAVIGVSRDDDLGPESGSAYVFSPEGCKLALSVEPLTPRAGEQLRVAVDLHHRRPLTVTVPFLLWVEDATGQVVVQKSSPPVTLEPGDHRKLRLAVTLPARLLPGTYKVLVGVKRMQQGIAWASRDFEIVE